MTWKKVETGHRLEIIQNDLNFALWSYERITRRVEEIRLEVAGQDKGVSRWM